MGLRGKRHGLRADGLRARSPTAVVASVAAVLFATLVLLAVDFYLAA